MNKLKMKKRNVIIGICIFIAAIGLIIGGATLMRVKIYQDKVKAMTLRQLILQS